MFPPRFTEVIFTRTRSPSMPVTSPNTGVPLRMRCPSSVRQFSASCILRVEPTITVCVECTNALMAFLSSCLTSRTVLNPLRAGARGTLSMALRCPGRTSSSFFSCKAGFSFPLEATGCCTGTVIPAPSSRSLSRISSCMRRISLSFPAVSAGSSVTRSNSGREADLLVFSFPTFWSMSSRVKLSLIRVLRITSPVSGSLLPEAGRLAMNAHTSRTTTIPKPASMAILLFPSRVIRARIVGHRYGRRNRTYFPESAEWHG